MAENLVSLLRESRERYADRALFGERVGSGWRWTTYAQFDQGVERYAEQLAALGVGAGDRVVIAGPWCLRSAQFAHAVCRREASFVPLSAARELDAWRFILGHAAPRVAVAANRADRLVLEALQHGLNRPCSVVELEGSVEQARASLQPQRPLGLAKDQVASLCYYRADSGLFAAKVLTHRALCRRATSLQHTSYSVLGTLSEVLLLRAVFEQVR